MTRPRSRPGGHRRRSARLTPAQARRDAELHLVARWDRDQLATLAAMDDPCTPMVIPRGSNRVCTTEPIRRGGLAGLAITADRPRATRDAVVLFLDRDLIDAERQVQVNDHGEARTAHVLALTRHGRDVLTTARKIGYLP